MFKRKLAAVLLVVLSLGQDALAFQPEPEELPPPDLSASDAGEESKVGGWLPLLPEEDAGSFGIPASELEEKPLEFVYDPLHHTYPAEATLSADSDDMAINFPKGCESYGDALAAKNPVFKTIYDIMENFLSAKNLDSLKLEERTFTYMGQTTPTKAKGIVCNFGYPKGVNSYNDFGSYSRLAYAAWDNDHPCESSGLTGRTVYLIANDKSGYELLFWLVDDDLDRYKTKRKQLSAAADSFASQFYADGVDSLSTLVQYRYIHDKLSRGCRYNYPALDWESSEHRYQNAHDAYGALVGGDGCDKGSVVCQGYTDAYQLVCQRVGLPNIIVYGRTGEGWTGSHIWNYIQLDRGWYAVDLTWDDIDTTYNKNFDSTVYTGAVDVSYTKYEYFGDNRYFVESDPKYNHQASPRYFFGADSWSLEPPPLAYSGPDALGKNEGLWPEYAALGLRAKEGEAAQLSDIFIVVNYCNAFSDFRFSSIPVVDITVPDGTEFCRFKITSGNYRYRTCCTVPKGFRYCISAENETARMSRRYDDAETGRCFDVEPGGTLLLKGLSMDGSGVAASDMLVNNMGTLILENTSVRNNQGSAGYANACGVYCGDESLLSLSGGCIIEGNTGNGVSANLYLAPGSRVGTEEGLTGSVGVSGAESELPVDYPGNIAELEGFFRSDNPGYCVMAVDSTLRLWELASTDNAMPAWFTYPKDAKLPMITGGRKLTLYDAGRQVETVYTAAYDGLGHQLWVADCAVGSDGALTLPEASAQAALYQVFALDGQSRPCAEALRFPAA